MIGPADTPPNFRRRGMLCLHWASAPVARLHRTPSSDILKFRRSSGKVEVVEETTPHTEASRALPWRLPRPAVSIVKTHVLRPSHLVMHRAKMETCHPCRVLAPFLSFRCCPTFPHARRKSRAICPASREAASWRSHPRERGGHSRTTGRNTRFRSKRLQV